MFLPYPFLSFFLLFCGPCQGASPSGLTKSMFHTRKVHNQTSVGPFFFFGSRSSVFSLYQTGVRRTDFLGHPCCTVVGLVLKRQQDTCITLEEMSHEPPSVVGAPLYPSQHRVRERESDFERLVRQNLWRLESRVKQVGDFASSGNTDTVPCGEEPTRVVPGAVFEIVLHIGEELAAQLILTVVQEFTNCCPRRVRTSGGAVDDRVRGRYGGGGILQ